MKHKLLCLAFSLLSVFNFYSQTNSYSFTNGSLTGLTHTGTALTNVPDRINVANNAIDINSDYLRATSTSAPQKISISFWVKTTTNDGNKRTIIDQSQRNSPYDNNSDPGWYAYLKNGKVGLAANYYHSYVSGTTTFTMYTGYSYTESTTDLSDGNWHNVILISNYSTFYQNGYWKRFTYSVYVDGVLENSQTVDRGSGAVGYGSAALLTVAKGLTIANNNTSNLGTTERYADEIDDIRYYSNTIVNSTQINQLANENRCDVPQNITFGSITPTGATVNWNTDVNASTWDLIYVPAGQPMNNGTLISAIATNSYTITGLNSSTAYDVYLKANCSGYSSWWSTTNAFTTLCPSTFANAIAQNITIQLGNSGSASITANDINNGSSVDCGVMTLLINQTDFDCSDIGIVPVTLTVTDNQGHTSTANANVTVNGTITNETLTVNNSSICSGQSAIISTSSSMTGVTYSLRNDATNSVIGSPIAGTGNALSFNTGTLTSNQTFNLYAEHTPNNYALDFDGTNDIVTTNLTTNATSTFTVEAWVYPRSSNYDRIISNFTGANVAGQIVFDTYDANNNGKGLRLYLVGPGNVVHQTSTSNALTLNAWNHVATTFDNGTVKLYVNGVLKTTSTAPYTSIPTSASTYNFGEDQVVGTAEHLNGKLDEIRFWTTARTLSEISSNMNSCLQGNESGLFAYFKLSEGTGNTITDLVNGKIGTLTNMDSATDWVTGQVACSSGCPIEMAQTITVNVGDNIAPVPNNSSLTTLTDQCQISALIPPTATDNCAGTITATHNKTLPITTSTTITWTYNDGNGNSTTQTQSVVINDNIAPVPNTSILNAITSQCSIISLTAPTALDNCAGTITGTHNASFPISANTTVVWTYNDGHGNISTQNQIVTINDNIAPVPDVSSLSDITAQCEVTSLNAPTATDNCSGTITATHNAIFPITSNTTVTWTYNDGKGNISTQTQNIIIQDITAPVPNNITLSDITDQCIITTLTAPSATDNCEGIIIGTHNATFPIVTNTTITWTYIDGSGNSSSQTQNVVINDITAPIPTLNALPDLTDQCSISSLVAPTANDNCVGLINGITNTTLPITSSTTITWTFNDGHGNSSTQTQNIVINDVTTPVPSLNSLPDLNDQCSISTLVPPTAIDNCTGLINGTTTIILPITASTTITWTFDDGHGNSSTQTQNVVINDVTAPVPNTSTLPNLTSNCSVSSLTPPTATDNCSGIITGTHNVTLPIVANTTITWTFDDGHGNTSTQTQNAVITSLNTNVTVSSTELSADFSTADSYQWMDCDNGNQIIPSETNATFTPTQSGNYAVIITEGTCSETSTCYNYISILNLIESNKLHYSLTPNPARNILKIESAEQIENVTIYSLTGELMFSENVDVIDVHKLIAGMYIIKIKTRNAEITDRFVKE